MRYAIGGARPRVDPTAIVAPTAVLSGDVTLGSDVYVSFGAVLIGDDGPVVVGAGTVIREQVVIRAAQRHAVRIGWHVLIGAHSALYGCTVDDEAFLATGVTIFHGARIGTGAEIRVRGVVHVNTVIPEKGLVPIGWIAAGNPATIRPPSDHDEIWSVQRALDFPGIVYGVERGADGSIDMRLVTARAVAAARERRWELVGESEGV